MKAAELEQFISQFFTLCREAKADLEAATEAEQYPNSAIQDILHALEFAPKQLDAETIKWKLHELRVDRRDAKKELEVTTLWADWCDKNKKSLDTLQQVLGQMRKILRRQPHDFYAFKTDVIGEKGDYLQADPPEEPEYIQMKMEGF